MSYSRWVGPIYFSSEVQIGQTMMGSYRNGYKAVKEKLTSLKWIKIVSPLSIEHKPIFLFTQIAAYILLNCGRYRHQRNISKEKFVWSNQPQIIKVWRPIFLLE